MQLKNNYSHLFILGTSPYLSQAEIQSLFSKEESILIAPDVLLINISKDVNTNNLISRLGGTVKIAGIEKIGVIKNDLPQNINEILNSLKSSNNERIIFGVSIHGGTNDLNIRKIVKEIKSIFDRQGRKSRFILPTEGNILSSVQITKEKINEIIIVSDKSGYLLAKTLAVQDFEDWGLRDYGRPFVSPKIGMLPPKVARMMVNIALKGQKAPTPVVLDPFCGVGTIAQESLLLGCWSINSDKDKEACQKTKKNLEWLSKTYDLNKENFSVIESDAALVDIHLPKASVDVIVTEPYLGQAIEIKNKVPVINFQQRLTPKKIEKILDGLERMYKGALKSWLKILKKEGRVVIILPVYDVWGEKYFMKSLIDSCEKIGYNIEAGPYEYARLKAIVKRHIYVLKPI